MSRARSARLVIPVAIPRASKPPCAAAIFSSLARVRPCASFPVVHEVSQRELFHKGACLVPDKHWVISPPSIWRWRSVVAPGRPEIGPLFGMPLQCLHEETRSDRRALRDGPGARRQGDSGPSGAGRRDDASPGRSPPGGVSVPGGRLAPVSQIPGLAMYILAPRPPFLPGVLPFVSAQPSRCPIAGASPSRGRPGGAASLLPGWLPAFPVAAGAVGLGLLVLPPIPRLTSFAAVSGGSSPTAPLFFAPRLPRAILRGLLFGDGWRVASGVPASSRDESLQ